VKAWLSHAGVPYVVRNVDGDLTAYDELLARGFRTVPVTVIGDDAVVGYQPEALAAAISRAAAG
jgi:glutaredoxin